MYNEILFVVQSVVVSVGALGAARMGVSSLVAYSSLLCVLANVFVTKQITLFAIHATGADGFSVGATFALNLLQEFYGASAARKAIYTNIGILIVYVLFTQIHLWYIPSSEDVTQNHFVVLFAPMVRIVIASFVSFFISQSIDYQLYGFLKHQLASRWLLIRNYGSMIVSQGVDTVLFTMLGLYGTVPHIAELIFVSYAIKLCAIVISGIGVIALQRYKIAIGTPE